MDEDDYGKLRFERVKWFYSCRIYTMLVLNRTIFFPIGLDGKKSIHRKISQRIDNTISLWMLGVPLGINVRVSTNETDPPYNKSVTIPNMYDTFAQCWFKAGPVSATLNQHCVNVSSSLGNSPLRFNNKLLTFEIWYIHFIYVIQ